MGRPHAGQRALLRLLIDTANTNANDTNTDDTNTDTDITMKTSNSTIDQSRASISNDLRAELGRRGNVRLHQDIGLQHFASDGSSGPWTARRSVVEFLHAGKSDTYNALSGIVAKTSVDEALTTLEKHGAPARFAHFCVTGIGFEFGKPFDTDEGASSGSTTTGTLTGPESEFTKRIATQLIRNMLVGADVRYVLDDECTQLLGPLDQHLSGKGFYGAADLATNGVPMESERKSLRDHAIILPPSAEGNKDRYILRVTFSNLRTTPIDPDAAVPASTDVVAVPIYLTLDGYYCDAQGNPVDDYETRVAGLDAAA